ncbi:serine hydrolase domain-containing protein [Xenorhabdus bovienii]|uniref:serine hydrolase domain-containing protein n=1 Tax=Xenorhabdus bovienii TaxID=40576 RepID=UPI00237CF25C|nr:serine hydrolase domain-containing protein [Xenorhabdus bovienii]MDE1474723.1 beta-lactamase family protein [Xenorhabdus bovienii]
MKFKYLFIFFSFIFINISYAATESTGNSALEKQLVEYMNVGKIPGLSIVILDSKKDAKFIFLGKERMNADKNIDGTTLFELASTSKAFTGFIAARLIEEGKIKGDTKVSSILPALSFYYDSKPVEVTFLQLLHHTSGIPFSSIDFVYGGQDNTSLADMLNKIDKIELQSVPGNRHSYSTINYGIAARMMEIVTQMSYQQLLQTYVLAPFNMNQISVEAFVENKSTGHQISYLAPRPYNAPFVVANVPAGYIQTNAIDMEKWLRFLSGDDYPALERAKKRMFTPDKAVATNEGNNSHYAMGWYVNGEKIFHTGMNPSFSSFVGVHVGSGTAVAVMANVNSNVTFAIGEQILDQLSSNQQILKLTSPDDVKLFDSFDRVFLIISLITLPFILFIGFRIYRNIFVKERASFSKKNRFILISLIIFCMFCTVLSLIFPMAILNISWQTFVIWMPGSFLLMSALLIFSLLVSIFNCSIILVRRIQFAKEQSRNNPLTRSDTI